MKVVGCGRIIWEFFGIIGEWDTAGLLSDNMFDLLFLKCN